MVDEPQTPSPAPVVGPAPTPAVQSPRVKAAIKAAKELACIAILGALSSLLSYGATQLGGLDPTSVYAIVLTVVLKIGDKYIHENEAIPVKGIVPF